MQAIKSIQGSVFSTLALYCILASYNAQIFAAAAPTAAKTKTKEVIYSGEARDKKGTLVYKERHVVAYLNSQIQNATTKYYDPSEKLIANLNSDYTRSVTMPTYEFEDLRFNNREGLRYIDGKYWIYVQEGAQKEKSKELKDTQSVFSCQGWHYYLVDNLNLLEKNGVSLKLVLPSQLDAYSFNIKKTQSNEVTTEARLEIDNWLLHLFAPSLRLVYDKQKKKLVEYEGVSNIADGQGNRQDVKILYFYE